MSEVSKHFWIVLLLVASFCVFFELGRMDVWSDNEGQRATPPAEMVRTGDFLIPTLNGEDYLAKPPLLYWLNAGSYILTGAITPLTARIPTALCFITLVLCVYFYARRTIGEMAARWAAVAVLASPYILQRSRVTEIDIPLTLAAFLAIIAFRAACQSSSGARSAIMTVLSGVAIGAGLLLKGPPVLIFMAAAWMAQTLLSSEHDEWLRKGLGWTLVAFSLGALIWVGGLIIPTSTAWMRFPLPLIVASIAWIALAWTHGAPCRGRILGLFLGSVAIGLVVAAPWALAVVARKGWPFIVNLVQSEMIERTHTATRINAGSPFYYLLGLLGTLAPWSFLFPLQFVRSQWTASSAAYRFNILLGWLSVVFFSMIAGKEHEYILPAVPFLLIGLGVHLANIAKGCDHGWMRRYGIVWRDGMVIVLTIGTVGFFIYLFVSHQPWPLLLEAGTASVVAAAVTVYGWRHHSKRMLSLTTAALCVNVIVLLSQSFYFTDIHSTRGLAEVTGNLLKNGYDVQAVKMTNAFGVFPGFAFHSQTIIPVTIDENEVVTKLLRNKPFFCVLRQDALIAVAQNIPPEFLRPLLGPYGRKKLVLIGNTSSVPL